MRELDELLALATTAPAEPDLPCVYQDCTGGMKLDAREFYDAMREDMPAVVAATVRAIHAAADAEFNLAVVRHKVTELLDRIEKAERERTETAKQAEEAAEAAHRRAELALERAVRAERERDELLEERELLRELVVRSQIVASCVKSTMSTDEDVERARAYLADARKYLHAVANA